MSWFSVDCESDGPCPPLYSLVCFGAVKIDDKLDKTFYGQTEPISNDYQSEALAISGFSRKEHNEFFDPEQVFKNFKYWIEEVTIDRPIMVSDNPAYDWQWINYYFHKYTGSNPFGFSARRIGDIYCGMMKDVKAPWKHKLRKTKHTHNPVDDAKGNAEAVLAMRDMGLKIKV